MPKLVWRVKRVAELEPGVTTETELALIERDMQQNGHMPFAYYLILAMLSETPGQSLRMNELATVAPGWLRGVAREHATLWGLVRLR